MSSLLQAEMTPAADPEERIHVSIGPFRISSLSSPGHPKRDLLPPGKNQGRTPVQPRPPCWRSLPRSAPWTSWASWACWVPPCASARPRASPAAPSWARRRRRPPAPRRSRRCPRGSSVVQRRPGRVEFRGGAWCHGQGGRGRFEGMVDQGQDRISMRNTRKCKIFLSLGEPWPGT